jgi:NAD(P)-dependent dehydrogenase (short-subunit alcohol dehydrogenase family)
MHMDKSLINKTYIITGASSGMGRATALKFAQEGAQLILSGRDEAKGQQVVNEILSTNGIAVFYPGDNKRFGLQ